MNHDDHVNLIREGVRDGAPGGTWADLGSGTGAFTLALADLLGTDARIVSLDRDAGALAAQRRALAERFPRVPVQYVTADFTRPLTLPPLDGLLMANALHFVREQEPLLARLLAHVKPGGRFLLVEYNTDEGNVWVPYPLSYPTWERRAARVGLVNTRLLVTRTSRFLHEIYSAVSVKGGG